MIDPSSIVGGNGKDSKVTKWVQMDFWLFGFISSSKYVGDFRNFGQGHRYDESTPIQDTVPPQCNQTFQHLCY